MSAVLKGSRPTNSSSSRFSENDSASPCFMNLVTPECAIQMPPMKAKLM